MRIVLALVMCGALGACGGGSTPSSGPSTPTGPSSGGTTETFSVDLPVAAGDTANATFGIWPFGVHGASHAADRPSGIRR